MELVPTRIKEERAEALAINLKKIDSHRQLDDISPVLLDGAEALAYITNPIIIAAQSIRAHISKLRGGEQPQP